MKQIRDAENSVLHEAWTREFGKTIKYKFFFGVSESVSLSLAALELNSRSDPGCILRI